ncbi:MAG: hypothetical protein AcusKO_26230 [Acuticoccus sp.]
MMDMRLLARESSSRQHVGIVAGFHGAERTPVLKSPLVSWTSDEDGLFRSDIAAFVIQDCRLLSDLTLALTVGRPTLFVIDDPVDLAHLAILLSNREIVLTPYDAIYAPTGLPRVEGIFEHVVSEPQTWISAFDEKACSVPPGLAAFAHLSKADYSDFAALCGGASLGSIQHFWQIIGDHQQMAQTLLRTPEMIRVGRGGPFHDFTPTLIFADPTRAMSIAALPLRQSTIVVAPFALEAGEPIDGLFADFVDARPEPFHLHDVTTFGERHGHSLGCLYGEYAM